MTVYLETVWIYSGGDLICATISELYSHVCSLQLSPSRVSLVNSSHNMADK